jgi:hypothetical protein
MQLGQVQYELRAKNFACPDFHTCTMVDSLKICQDTLKSGVKGVCQPVSTNFIEMVGTSCGFKGRSVCYNPSGVAHPGPDKVMLSVHNVLSEKIYKYAVENGAWLALGGVTTVVLAFLLKKARATPKYLETSNKDQLTKLLQKAKISNGHWNGNRICFEGQTEKATFSHVSRRIDEIYSESVMFMRIRHENYKWSQEPTRFGIFMFIEAGIKILSSRRPVLNAEEEARVRDAMAWREDRHAQLNALFQRSEEQMNKNGSSLGKLWNATLDKLSSWRAVPLKEDREIFQQMVKNRF